MRARSQRARLIADAMRQIQEARADPHRAHYQTHLYKAGARIGDAPIGDVDAGPVEIAVVKDYDKAHE